MKLSPVKSSHIDAIGYDAATKTLAVQFKGGAVYHYHGVDSSVHERMLRVPSVGKYFAEHVKDKFHFTKQ